MIQLALSICRAPMRSNRGNLANKIILWLLYRPEIVPTESQLEPRHDVLIKLILQTVKRCAHVQKYATYAWHTPRVTDFSFPYHSCSADLLTQMLSQRLGTQDCRLSPLNHTRFPKCISISCWAISKTDKNQELSPARPQAFSHPNVYAKSPQTLFFHYFKIKYTWSKDQVHLQCWLNTVQSAAMSWFIRLKRCCFLQLSLHYFFY